MGKSKFECRVCGWDSYTKREVKTNNDIIGPGYEEQVLLEDYACNGCGAVFTDPQKFSRWNSSMPFTPDHPDVRRVAEEFSKRNKDALNGAMKNLKNRRLDE